MWNCYLNDPKNSWVWCEIFLRKNTCPKFVTVSAFLKITNFFFKNVKKIEKTYIDSEKN